MQLRSFRTVMATLMVVLVTATVGLLVFVQAQLFRRSVMTLADKIMEQTLGRVELRVQQLFNQATAIGQQTLRLIQDADSAQGDFTLLENFLAKSLEVHHALTSVGVAIADTGEYIVAERLAEGAIRVREVLQDARKQVRVADWQWQGSQRLFLGAPSWDGYDPRERPFYRLARERKAAVWTEAYPFWRDPNQPPTLGFSYVAPWYDAKGDLVGVVNADFELESVCAFLASLQEELAGFAIVIERTSDNHFRLIAHPRPEFLFDASRTNLVSNRAEVEDPVVRTYVSALAEDLEHLGSAEYGRRFRVDGDWYLGGFRSLEDPRKPPWVIAMMVPRKAITGDIVRNAIWSLAASLGCLGLALTASFWFARRMARPLQELSGEAERMGRLHFESGSSVPSSIREVRQLQQSMSEMKASLRSFRKYVPADLVHELIATGREARLGGQHEVLTILFSDISEFTAISEALTPQALVEQMGQYLLVVNEVFHAHRGTVDKYIGDGVMAFWGAPRPNPHHAADACRAAWRLQERLDGLARQWQAEGKPQWRTRMGLHTGGVVVGNIGSENRMNYTLIGDAVNLASRIEGLNKYFGTRILISEGTLESAAPAILARPVSRVVVKGKMRGVLVHELTGLAGEVGPEQRELADGTASAFALFEARDFARAREAYQAILGSHPGDPVARWMAARCAELERSIEGEGVDTMLRVSGK
ncbi:MAG TPA: adenylate/guanylate cyclase domain-containing protein [Verrucomicrobiota bacterium]|nr:adenylate/guanylate cyclase domain-containing protein [Verrucomicrobiota bacterium]HRZ56204.1 adenylate/guanylate cyclase domain-containing protein [Candidatus Paceibacterota bacterium]